MHRNANSLRDARLAHQKEKEIVPAAVRMDGLALKHAGPDLKKDKELVFANAALARFACGAALV